MNTIAVRLRLRLLIVVVAVMVLLAGPPSDIRAQQPPEPDRKVGSEVVAALQAAPNARVVVSLSQPAALRAASVEPAAARAEVGSLRATVLGTLTAADFQETVPFQSVPALAGLVTTAGLQKLAKHPSVVKIDLDVGGSGGLAQSVPLVDADKQHVRGNRGQGIVVAVLDSGLDAAHPDVSDGLIAEACFLNATSGSKCPNGTDRQVGAGSAADDHNHGTWVTGVIASNGVRASVGMAPDVQYVAVKVLDNTNSFAATADVVAAMDWVFNNRLDVRLVNMSLGTGARFAGDCDNATSFTQAFAAAVNNLRNRTTNPVLTMAASGNDSDATTMGAPGCIQRAISVGSTTKADAISTFSNASTTLDILAPGDDIVTSQRGGTTATVDGTSFATPHVTGCAALLLRTRPSWSPAVLETHLESSGFRLADARIGLTFPRLNCSPPEGRLPLAVFDGGGRADPSITRLGAGPNGQALWWSPDAGFTAPFPNVTGDIPVPADYDGDTRTDMAFYRPSNGLWFGQRSSNAQLAPWFVLGGQSGDIPVPCDYNGDGQVDPAFFRPSTGLWFGLNTAGNQVRLNSNASFGSFGQTGDVPAVGDYDGDGRCDVAIFRPTAGLWYGLKAANGQVVLNSTSSFGALGQAGDIPVPADYNGDGKTDVAYFRPSNGRWFGLTTTGAIALPLVVFGANGDIPVPSYYDGDSKADVAFFRPSSGQFTAIASAGGPNFQRFFAPGDIPLLKRPAPAGYPY